MVVGHICEAPVSFILVRPGQENVRIPVIDDGAVIHERKDGPIGLSRRAEIDFPITDGNTDWIDYIAAFEAEGRMEEIIVEMRPYDVEPAGGDNRVPVFRGYITSVGTRASMNTAHITALGPFKLLQTIGAGADFPSTVTPRDVLEYVVRRFNDANNVMQDIRLGQISDTHIIADDLSLLIGGSLPKWFSASRDTLADVLNWISELSNITFWFDLDDDGTLVLRGARDLGEEYDATEGGDVILVENDAVYEMRPFNTVIANGSSASPIDVSSGGVNFGQVNVPIDRGKFVQADASYDPLVERAGGEIPKRIDVDQTTEESVRAAAERRLKEMLDEVSGGTMKMALAPYLMPYDRLIARPACANLINTQVPELRYEVQRTAHRVSPSPSNATNDIPMTEVSVSMAVDPDLITSETTTKSSQPSEGGENKPPEKDPTEQLPVYLNI